MIGGVLKKVFGSANDRMLARLKGEVDAINAFEPEVQKLSDEALKAQTDKFRERIKAGETLDKIMVEAFEQSGKPQSGHSGNGISTSNCWAG